MSVLHVLRSLNIGGIEAQARDQAGELVRRRRSTELVILADRPIAEAVRAWHKSVVPLVEWDDRQSWIGVDRVLHLARQFRVRREGIIHFHYALPDSIVWSDVLAAKLAGKSTVVTLHHVIGWPRTAKKQELKQWVARRCVDQFVATTHAAKVILSEQIKCGRIAVVPCGIRPPARVSTP